MEIRSEILKFDPICGSVVVQYYTDEFLEGLTYAIDVPIVDGAYADEETILKVIDQYKPTEQLKRMIGIKTAEIPEYLKNKIAPVVVIEDPENPIIFGVDPLPSA